MTDENKKTPKCDHKDHIISGGIVPVSSPDGLVILVVVICSKCGSAMVKDIKIGGVNMRPKTMGMPVSPDLLNKIMKKKQ